MEYVIGLAGVITVAAGAYLLITDFDDYPRSDNRTIEEHNREDENEEETH